ncbi:MAG: hypothetical protein EKK48_12060 [Candidatus Melainabacteria bacterium]|nr:MAG: hypothetical protein EKK48_12060 [Candidatus Melainabacteria bacterium]
MNQIQRLEAQKQHVRAFAALCYGEDFAASLFDKAPETIQEALAAQMPYSKLELIMLIEAHRNILITVMRRAGVQEMIITGNELVEAAKYFGIEGGEPNNDNLLHLQLIRTKGGAEC